MKCGKSRLGAAEQFVIDHGKEIGQAVTDNAEAVGQILTDIQQFVAAHNEAVANIKPIVITTIRQGGGSSSSGGGGNSDGGDANTATPNADGTFTASNGQTIHLDSAGNAFHNEELTQPVSGELQDDIDTQIDSDNDGIPDSNEMARGGLVMPRMGGVPALLAEGRTPRGNHPADAPGAGWHRTGDWGRKRRGWGDSGQLLQLRHVD